MKILELSPNPSQTVQNLGKRKDSIETGRVPDVRTFLTDADTAVILIHLGGGTKLKHSRRWLRDYLSPARQKGFKDGRLSMANIY